MRGFLLSTERQREPGRLTPGDGTRPSAETYRGEPMPTYRVVFLEPLGETPVRSISFDGDDAGQALLLAQNHDGPAELWQEDQRVCTLLRSGNYGELWVISNRPQKRPRRGGKNAHKAAGTVMLAPGFDGTPSEELAMSDQKRHDDPPARPRSE